jgi:RNA 3'-terminal phosphate cyclase
MTARLQQAFEEAAKLPESVQEVLASRLLAELSEETAFDRKLAQTTDVLSKMALAALEEEVAGLTEELDPDQL